MLWRMESQFAPFAFAWTTRAILPRTRSKAWPTSASAFAATAAATRCKSRWASAHRGVSPVRSTMSDVKHAHDAQFPRLAGGHAGTWTNSSPRRGGLRERGPGQRGLSAIHGHERQGRVQFACRPEGCFAQIGPDPFSASIGHCHRRRPLLRTDPGRVGGHRPAAAAAAADRGRGLHDTRHSAEAIGRSPPANRMSLPKKGGLSTLPRFDPAALAWSVLRRAAVPRRGRTGNRGRGLKPLLARL